MQRLRWNYGADGVLNSEDVEIKVFAVEMVYVTTGAYALGSGGTEPSHFFNAATTHRHSVLVENAPITVGTNYGNLNYANDYPYFAGDHKGPIPAAFPKGYNAFWIVKYECSRQQYLDFLTNIDQANANNRAPCPEYVVLSGTYPNWVVANPEKAVGHISINDYLAFADWAALRPFTELEFEKACRGANQAPVPMNSLGKYDHFPNNCAPE